MAWLQNLSGQAENFLNKIDEKAAGVLKATNSKFKHHKNAYSISTNAKNVESSNSKEANIPNENQEYENREEIECQNDEETFEIYDENELDVPLETVTIVDSVSTENKTSQNLLDCSPTPGQVSSRLSSSYTEDISSYEYIEKIEDLEYKNDSLNKELLNVLHLYSTVDNENVTLKKNLERANEMIETAKREMEQYKARTHRILKEREGTLGLKFENESVDESSEEKNIIDQNILLKKELRTEQYKNEEFKENVANLTSKVLSLQQLNDKMQNKFQECNQKMKKELATERKTLMLIDQDLSVKTQELGRIREDLRRKESELMVKNHEIEQLRNQLTKQTPETELHDKFQSLTQALIINQRKLEAAISEKNGLKIQLETLENEYSKALTRNYEQQNVHHNDTDDVKLQTPEVAYSASDAVVTRRIKHAYSCLNAFSIKIGIFLRRHPRIRVIIFGYMVLMHFWMLIILLNYAPSI